MDDLLGGGLLPGTLTVVAGATGIGKTQLGLQFAHLGQAQEGRRGVVFDMSCRGDSQSHAEYARRMFHWQMSAAAASRQVDLHDFFAAGREPGDYLHVFEYQGRRITRQEADFELWRQWQSELNAKLAASLAFLYGNFVRGVRRVVVDGLEPVENPADSIQFELFEYLDQQVLRKDPQWVARDLFRQDYRRNAEAIAQHIYDPARLACLLLYTSPQTMLDDLISRPIAEGDLLANANTVIYLGKIREGNQVVRGLYIAKHRGSACSEGIMRYVIDEQGLRMNP